ncbi:MAG: hypothetical protein ACLQVI_28940 [Polyangiaceae bacterium]
MTPKEQLDVFLDRFTPDVAKLARGALARMRKLTPGALELVYDNYNALAIGFSPTQRASDGIFSIAVFPRHPSLFFLQGAKLPDPAKRLRGSGNVVRHIVIEGLELFDEPAVCKLIEVALARAKVRLPPVAKKQPRQVIIKSVSAKQRPRRPVKA